jgi:hypothetical protein
MSTNKIVLNTGIYKRIDAIPMSTGERQRAVTALQDGENIADAILIVARFLRLLVTMPHLNPVLKGQ